MKAFFKEKKKAYSRNNTGLLTRFQTHRKTPEKHKTKGTRLHYFPNFEDLKNREHEMIDIFKDSKNEVLGLFFWFLRNPLALVLHAKKIFLNATDASEVSYNQKKTSSNASLLPDVVKVRSILPERW